MKQPFFLFAFLFAEFNGIYNILLYFNEKHNKKSDNKKLSDVFIFLSIHDKASDIGFKAAR